MPRGPRRRRSRGNPFWAYSLRLYGRPGVAPACLALQDRLGVDVNALLFCLWAGDRGIGLAPRTMALITGLSRLWSRHVVGQLRGTRRFLKPLGLPALRAEVAKVELAAERLEQDLLLRLLPSRKRPSRAGRTARAEIAADNVAAYLRRLAARIQAADRRQLQVILAAAFPAVPD